jgi:hypothetical protein
MGLRRTVNLETALAADKRRLMQMHHVMDASKPFTTFGGQANTGSALNIRVYLRLISFSRIRASLVMMRRS